MITPKRFREPPPGKRRPRTTKRPAWRKRACLLFGGQWSLCHNGILYLAPQEIPDTDPRSAWAWYAQKMSQLNPNWTGAKYIGNPPKTWLLGKETIAKIHHLAKLHQESNLLDRPHPWAILRMAIRDLLDANPREIPRPTMGRDASVVVKMLPQIAERLRLYRRNVKCPASWIAIEAVERLWADIHNEGGQE